MLSNFYASNSLCEEKARLFQYQKADYSRITESSSVRESKVCSILFYEFHNYNLDHKKG